MARVLIVTDDGTTNLVCTHFVFLGSASLRIQLIKLPAEFQSTAQLPPSTMTKIISRAINHQMGHNGVYGIPVKPQVYPFNGILNND
jgi:hypothetical protein